MIECEAEQRAQAAIAQTRERGCAEPYRDGACEIHLIGAVFDADARSLAALRHNALAGLMQQL